MAETADLVDALSKTREVLGRLLETNQNMLILQALEAGLGVHAVKSLVGVSTDRVTRISKLRPKMPSKTSN
jgi:hypothetical protein